jgi:hypothetical protein
MIPVPERGEIYIRYGDPVGVGSLGAGVVVPGGGSLSAAEIDRIVDAMNDRLREIVRSELERMNLEGRIEGAAARGALAPPTTQTGANPNSGNAGASQFVGPAEDRGLHAPTVYGGLGVSSPGHFVIGGRVETGRLERFNALAIVPEFALGFADGGKSLMLVGNLEYQFGGRSLGSGFAFVPMVRAGLGVLSVPGDGTQGVLNFTYGFSTPIGRGSARWFAEHQGIDLFARNRLVAGLRWGL